MDKKYDQLLAFFYSVLNEASNGNLPLYAEFLEEIGAGGKRIRNTAVEDPDMKEVLKNIEYSKKIKKALQEFEPPAEAKERIAAIMEELSKAVVVYFEPFKPGSGDVVTKAESDSYFDVFVTRKYFKEDNRLELPDDVYRFHLGCYYRKETAKIEIQLSVSVNVFEKEIMGVTSEDFVMFDGFAGALGFSNALNDKRVYFNATIEEGVTYEDNPCNIEWRKEVKP